MTAPVSSASTVVADINAQIAAIQARIASFASLTQTGAGTAASGTLGSASGTAASSASGTSASNASDFASTLSSVSNGAYLTSSAGAPTASTSGGTASGSGITGADVVADAKKYLGIDYVWGGESTSGMDCSGLVQQTYKDLGVSLPRVAADQQKVGTKVDSLADAQPGDLLFFGQPAHHVAIYAGNNQMIEAPYTGQKVRLVDIHRSITSISRVIGSDVDHTGTASASPAASTVSAGNTGLSGVTGSGLAATGLTTSGSAAGGLSASQITAAGLNAKVAAYAPQFATAEAKYQLPAGLLAAVAQQESGGNPHAVSKAGALGLMQLMPATAKSHGVNALDPSQAIDAAGKILSANLKQFNGSVDLALAAYNAGAGAVQRYNGIPPYTETQNYVRSIDAMRARLSGSTQ